MPLLARLCQRSASILSTDYRASADALGAYRIAYAVAHLAVIGISQVSWIDAVPAAFFDPAPGLATLMPGFPPDWVLSTVDASLLVLYVALLVGFRTRWVSVAISLLLVYGHLFRFSFGKIDHDAIAILTPALFAWSWGRSFSIDASQRDERSANDGLSRGLLASLLAFGFFTSGFPKLVRWVDFDLSTHGVLHWVLNTERDDRSAFLVPFFRRLENPWVWEALDIGAVVFELAAIVALFIGSRAFKGWCVIAVLFHFFNYLMLNISFSLYLPLYMAFIDWQPAADRARHAASRARSRLDARAVLVTALIAALLVVVISRQGDGGNWSLLTSAGRVLPFAGWMRFLIFASASAIALILGTRAVVKHASAGRNQGSEAPRQENASR